MPQVSERLGLRHKTIAQWARQMIRVVRRWLPHVAITVLGDQAHSVVELGHACRRCGVRLIAPLRLDAVLHEAPPPRQPGTWGRPRLKGRRLPTLAERLDDAATPWQSLRVRWYDGRVRWLQMKHRHRANQAVGSGTALWYRSGQPPLPLTWVLVRHGDAQYPPRAFFSTCSSDQADDIVTCFIKRWSIETTFEESRAHLGFETQRQWSDLATERTTPCLLSLYSLVALLAHDLYLDGRLAVRTSSLVCQRTSDVQRCFGSGAATSVGSRVFFNINARHRVDRSPSGLSAGLDAIGLLYALTPVEFVQSRAKLMG